MMEIVGIPASPGLATGKAFCYEGNEFPKIRRLNIGNIEEELKRLQTAFDAAGLELQVMYEQALREMGKEQADIFAAHIMMNEDPDFRDQITERIKGEAENADWAVLETTRNLTEMIMASPDPVFRERATDLNDVSKRILNHLLGIKNVSLSELDRDLILVANDLMPSEILTMNKKHVKGIVTSSGGRTSHTAILARAFNIPAVLGLAAAMQEISNDDVLIVDGSKGEVLINPTKKELDKYEKAQIMYQEKEDEFSKLRDLPAETRDGCRVVLKANVETLEEMETVLHYGAEGIGLYRSEFLFLSSGKDVDEEYQKEAYSKALKAMGDKVVTIRTVDIGGDKIFPDFHAPEEKNPLLGWRAIRFSLARPEFLKTQLRAILRSSVNGKARIMFPLVSGLEELERALALLEEAKTECRDKGQAYDENIETGTMIEVPSAALIADILAVKSDFLSIGTNDLIQYSLAVDRGNEQVSYLAQPSHPAVIRLIKMTIDAAHKQGIKAAMCGEMAGDPAFTALLLGLGLDEFSMSASYIPQVKEVIRSLSMEDCRTLAGELLQGLSATQNALLLDNMGKK